jgi:hypothetical protein
MPLLRSWVDSANAPSHPFPLNNLPCGVFSRGEEEPRCGVAIGDFVLDVSALEEAGVLTLPGAPLLDVPFWNEVMEAGPGVWAALRARLMELLKQKQYTPYPVEDQVVSIWAGTNGHLDEVEVADVLDFEQALLEHVRRTTNVMDSIVGSGKLEDDAVAALETAVAEVKRDFRGTKHGIEPGHEEHEPLDASAVDQERIVRK